MIRGNRIQQAGRRAIVLLVTLVALAHAPFAEPARAVAPAQTAAPVLAVDAVSMTVADADRSVAFYHDVLSFEKISDVEVSGDAFEHLTGVFAARARVVRMRLGDEYIELTEYLAPKGRPIPVDSRSNDLWFQHIAIIVSDMDRVYDRLRSHKVEHVSPGPQRIPDWNKNAGGIRAFYFKDPDGHPLEVLWFPADKGPAKWHKTDRLFLGIDHTAIAVWDTDASIAFYRDTLGLNVVGESENYGVEQERLNSVFGAHLRITGLRAASGPGIEFLEYQAPRDGRPFPADERANDLVHRRTRLVAADADALGARLRQRRYALVSSGVVGFDDPTFGMRKSGIVRDPDGHAVEFFERAMP